MFCVMNEVALVFFTTCRSAHNEMHQQKQHVKTIGSLHQHGQDAMVPNDGFIVVYVLHEQTTCMLIAKQMDTKI